MKRSLIYATVMSLLAFSGCDNANPIVIMSTPLGDISIEIFVEETPITASNFLSHVDQNSFDGATFYRVVRDNNQPSNDILIDVIQGGIGDRAEALTPIPHETTEQTGVLHTDGVISMARTEPGTATTEIFICVGDQPELDFGGRRNPDGQGFSTFGRVISGMDVVRAIHQTPAEGQYLDPEIPITDVRRAN